MAHDRILVVEDEPTVAEVVDRYLRRDGYDVSVCHDGLNAMDEYDRFQPDLVVLDLMLPRMDGMEVCRRIRSRASTPIIMLTARGDEVDKLVGLEIGADDYITKPFSPRELAARVKAVLRRASAAPLDGDSLRFNGLRINGRTRTVEDERGGPGKCCDGLGTRCPGALPDEMGPGDSHLLVGAEERRAQPAEGPAQRHLAVGPLARGRDHVGREAVHRQARR